MSDRGDPKRTDRSLLSTRFMNQGEKRVKRKVRQESAEVALVAGELVAREL